MKFYSNADEPNRAKVLVFNPAINKVVAEFVNGECEVTEPETIAFLESLGYKSENVEPDEPVREQEQTEPETTKRKYTKKVKP